MTREQCVAALLVGAVVVLLGFASGLGLGPAVAPQAAALPSVSVGGDTTSGAASATPASSIPVTPPVAYVLEPVPPAAATTAAGPVPTSPPSIATGSSSAPSPTVPTASSTSAPAAPSCPPDVLTQLLSALLPGRALADSGVLGLGGLLGSLTDLTSSVSGLTSSVSGLLALDPDQLLRHVTDALATLHMTSSIDGGKTPGDNVDALADSCTPAVGAALPLLADGATITAAAAAVEPRTK